MITISSNGLRGASALGPEKLPAFDNQDTMIESRQLVCERTPARATTNDYDVVVSHIFVCSIHTSLPVSIALASLSGEIINLIIDEHGPQKLYRLIRRLGACYHQSASDVAAKST
jgi:hypothetical protein